MTMTYLVYTLPFSKHTRILLAYIYSFLVVIVIITVNIVMVAVDSIMIIFLKHFLCDTQLMEIHFRADISELVSFYFLQ